MIILGIDTSCDDTCVSLLEIRNWTLPTHHPLEILSNVVSSQTKLHAKYGGVYPFLAKREHQKNLPIVFKKATKGIEIPKIDLISVTNGPGLEPCLWQGINFAKDLVRKLKRPLVPINHLEAHILANFVGKSQISNLPPAKAWHWRADKSQIFPAVCLVVSGGHTQLILMKDIGRHPPTTRYKILGETRDDAAGECFDKVARILGLGYPGGPVIAAQAAKFRRDRVSVHLPRPMLYTKDYDFSFSGLKTAVLYLVKQLTVNSKQLTIKQKREICHEVQQAIIDVLIKKTIKAAKDFRVKSIILGGGVVANDELRKQFQLTINNQQLAIKLLVPPKNLCTDNAAMVAITAYFNREKATRNWQKIKVNANLKI